MVDEPDDDGRGALIELTFDRPACLYSTDLVDVESVESFLFVMYDESGGILAELNAQGLGDNSYQSIDFDVCGVAVMVVEVPALSSALVGCSQPTRRWLS